MNINVFFKDFPSNIKALTTINNDGSYTVFINSRLNLEQQTEGYMHELKHISNNDFDRYNSDELEFIAHCYNY